MQKVFVEFWFTNHAHRTMLPEKRLIFDYIEDTHKSNYLATIDRKYLIPLDKAKPYLLQQERVRTSTYKCEHVWISIS